MKYIIFLSFLCFYTEGPLAAQNPIAVPEEMTSDSFDLENTAEDTTTYKHKGPLVSPYAAAQEKYNREPIERRDVDAEKWRKATEGIDYSDDKVKEQQQRAVNMGESNKTAALAGLFLEFMKWFFIIGGIGLLAFLMYRFVSEGNIFTGGSRKIGVNSEEIDLNNIEENLEIAELDPIIKKAIGAQNFPLAIRLYYLAILKELTLAGAIAWKKDKTNRIYVREMQPHPLMETFRKVTTIFERVWYGDTALDEAGFQSIQPSFQGLLKETRLKN
jgi:hypothetical protein